MANRHRCGTLSTMTFFILQFPFSLSFTSLPSRFEGFVASTLKETRLEISYKPDWRKQKPIMAPLGQQRQRGAEKLLSGVVSIGIYKMIIRGVEL